MKIEGKEYRTIWFENNVVKIIDQTKLPHQFIIKDLKTVNEAINAIKVMEVRGAPLIGGTAAYGMALAVKENNDYNSRWYRDRNPSTRDDFFSKTFQKQFSKAANYRPPSTSGPSGSSFSSGSSGGGGGGGGGGGW